MVNDKSAPEPEWLKKYFYGQITGKRTLLWEGKVLAILRIGGTTGRSGIGCQSYSRSSTEVMYKYRANIAELHKRIPSLEGRTKKADVAVMIEKAKALDAELATRPSPAPELPPKEPAVPLKEFTVTFQVKMNVKAEDREHAELSARQCIFVVSRLEYEVVGVEETK